MNTIEARPHSDVIVGTVSTVPVYTESLPDHVPHVSFHIDTAEGPGFNVHANAELAEVARATIRRHHHIAVTPGRIYKIHPNQITPDVDAKGFDQTTD